LDPFELTDPIETERLVLRPFERSDLDWIVAVQSSPDVTRLLYWGPRTEAEARESLAKKMAARAIRAEGDAISLAGVTKTTGELVADVVLSLRSAEHRQGEIGYIVPPDHQGRGYATEAVRPLLAIAFQELGMHRVAGHLEARNAASARVLEKLGFRREAHLVENEFVKGGWQSEVVYAMLDREWRAARSGGPA
jgi:RimJ/RimL family protein N-acetyltransferase